MRHSWGISDSPDLPIQAFRKALGKNRPETLEGGKGGSPSAPDPYNTANAQGQLNQQAAAYNKALNLGNYTSPFGSQNSSISSYDPVTGAPIYTTNVSASPQLQQSLDSLFNQASQSGDINRYAQANLRGLVDEYTWLNQQTNALNPQLANIGAGLSQQAAQNAQQQGQDAAYRAQSQYLDPQFAQQEESLGAKLAAQGLSPGTDAYSNAMRNFNNTRQQAYSNAQNQAILTGSQIGTQNWQNQLAGAQMNAGLLGQQASNLDRIGNQYGQQAGLFGQMSNTSQLPYAALQSIASLIPRGSTGNASINPADIASAIQNQYLGQLGQYNARQQGNNATMSNLAGLFGNLGRANSLYNMFSGNGLAGYGSALSSLSPELAGSLGDALGMSIGGVTGPSTQAGLDALIASFNGGAPAAAAGGAAEAGAAGATGASGAGAGGAGAGGAGLSGFAGAALPIATALPFALAAGGMLMGAFGKGDDGTPYTRANDAWTNAILKDPSLLQRFGQGDVSNYMQGMFGGSQWTPEQYQKAQDMLSAAAGGGSFFGNFLGAPEQGMGG